MWSECKRHFIPFIITIFAIVVTDLLVGVLIGLGISILFILHSNLQRPLRRIVEKHTSGDVLRIELANQVSFFNRAAIEKTLHEVPRGGRVLIDARNTVYIDPDIRDLIADFRDKTSISHGVEVSFVGMKDHDQLQDQIQFVDFTSREVQHGLTPESVLEILQAGNQRFLSGQRIQRDFGRQVSATAAGQFPIAAILGCIDSRAPAASVFDLYAGAVIPVAMFDIVARIG